jgi:hypothetical protein
MKLKLKQVNQDQNLLSIRPVNTVFVSRYRQAYRQGAGFPPITIDQHKMIVSGNHRYAALLAEFGEEHEIEVVQKKFKTDRDRLEFFANENTKHGNALDGISKKRISLALIKEGATQEDIARIFDVSVKRVISWGGNSVMVEIGKGKTEPMPAKRGLEATRPMTKIQYKEHIKADRGVPITSLTGQLMRWLRNGFVADTEVNRELLQELGLEIESWLKDKVKAA